MIYVIISYDAIISYDIQDTAGSFQICACQTSGIEAAVHSTCSVFQYENTDPVLLINLGNAFNSLNHLTALHNFRWLCPWMATILINSYRKPAKIFLDGDIIFLD